MFHKNQILQRLWRLIDRKAAGVQPRRAISKVSQPVKRLPKTYQDAATSLVDLGLVNSKKHKDKYLRASWDGSRPEIIDFYRRFHKELERRGYAFYAHTFFRPNWKQYELKRQGRSKAGPNQSPHNFGCAVDIVHSDKYWDLTRKQWDVIGTIGKEVARKANIPIVWGGDWDFWDPAHWELKDWRKIRANSLL